MKYLVVIRGIFVTCLQRPSCGCHFASTAIAHAQTLATPDLLALNELQVLAEAHPEAKELVGVAQVILLP